MQINDALKIENQVTDNLSAINAEQAPEKTPQELAAAVMDYVNTEISYYQSLLLVLQQERDILLSGLHDELLPNCENKLTLSEELSDIQKERQQLVDMINEQGYEISRLSQLVPWVDEAMQPRFRAILQEADILSKRLYELNQINRTYISEALETIGHILAIFSEQHAAGYNARGGQVPLSGRRLLAKEV